MSITTQMPAMPMRVVLVGGARAAMGFCAALPCTVGTQVALGTREGTVLPFSAPGLCFGPQLGRRREL